MSDAEDSFYRWQQGRLFTYEGDHVAFLAGWDAATMRAVHDGLMQGQVIPSRTTDPETSHAAAREIRVKAGSQRAHLLKAFAALEDFGATDEEAMFKAAYVSASSEYSKRCSELREAGYIEPTGETRTGSSGLQRIVSRITDKGRAAVRSL